MNMNGYEITAEVKMYEWFNLDENGKLTTSRQESLLDDTEVVQYCAFNKETGDELFTTDLEEAKQYVSNKGELL
jgi:hypothetical protein